MTNLEKARAVRAANLAARKAERSEGGSPPDPIDAAVTAAPEKPAPAAIAKRGQPDMVEVKVRKAGRVCTGEWDAATNAAETFDKGAITRTERAIAEALAARDLVDIL